MRKVSEVSMKLEPGNGESEPEGRPRDQWTAVTQIQLVRAVVPAGQSIATYQVLFSAAQAAFKITSCRADGLVYPNDVLKTLTTALDAYVLGKKP